ncbi:MAG: phosphoribosylformylglycinamidine cyclo-ligase [Candidatus Eremiobacteraeota bacterium]|nr:phosphoribosylformylglycinamidine cyclo-ligase [Candidatus Eremiobacteraeota bacterium]
MSDAYAAAGVSIAAGADAVERYRTMAGGARDPRVLEGIGAFAGCFSLRGYRDAVLVASTDGVGTKVLVAAALRRYGTIGQDLVNHCINDIACLNAQPLFLLDYLAMGRLRPDIAESIVAGIAAACRQNDVALLGGETAEMPDLYDEKHFEVAGTIVGAVERDAMLKVDAVVAGDCIIGLPANGFHTNGYTLVRKVIAENRYQDIVEGAPASIADALMAVHPSYLSHVRAVQAAGVHVKAMAHITGGGLPANVPRVLPDALGARFDRARWSVPVLMAQVVREAGLTDDEAYRTFNMGVGFCLIVARSDVARALAAARAALSEFPIPGGADLTAAMIGEVEPAHPCGPRTFIG